MERERRNQVNALLANGGFVMAGKEGEEERTKRIQAINDEFDAIVARILRPRRRQEPELRDNKFFQQGQAGMDRLRWAFKSSSVAELESLGIPVKVVDKKAEKEAAA